MGKWMNKILAPESALGGNGDQDGHIQVETLAQMIDGTIDDKERDACVKHLNSCPDCYELFAASMKSLPEEMFAEKKTSLWTGKILYSLAASVLLVLIAGGVFMKLNQPGPFLMASITLDQDIRDVLLENNVLVWEDPARIDRLETLLRAKGINVHDIDQVVLDAPYFQSKSLLGRDEVLSITIEKGIAHIRIIKKD